MPKKRTHKHWIYGTEWQENIVHPISQKHRRISSMIRHDLATGKLQRWVKKKKLKLTDSTYQRYEKEVLKR